MSRGLGQLATGAILGVLIGKFVSSHEVTLPEAFLYISIAFIIVGYWTFQAWLRIAEKDRLRKPEVEKEMEALQERIVEVDHGLGEATKQLETQNSRINAILLRIGLQ